MKTLITTAAMLIVLSADAQTGSTREGYELQWNKTLAVVPDSLQNGTYRLPAWSVAVHEADDSEVMGWWLADMAATSTAVTKGKPAKANGLRIAQVPAATMAMAAVSNERKARFAKLTIAFTLNDSVPATPVDGQEAYMRSLAVKYNRAAVQGQITEYEKQLAKAGDKLADTKGDVAKNQSNLTKANSRLEKIKSQRMKVEKSNAGYSGDIAGLEKKFALSSDPKDLKKLTKAREKLSKGESSLAKLMKQEAGVQGDITKQQGRLESNAGRAEEHGATKEELQQTLDALKRKHDSIQ